MGGRMIAMRSTAIDKELEALRAVSSEAGCVMINLAFVTRS